MVKEFGLLPEQPPSVEVDERTEEAKAHIAMLREVSKLFSTRDIVEEYVACKCFPVREGWSITSWAGREKCVGGLPMPDFSTSFGITKDGNILAVSLFLFFFVFLMFLCVFCTEVDPVAIEVLADEAIGAEAAKERTLLESKLGGTRNNRVFAFFEIEAPRSATDAWLAEAEERKKTKGEPSGAAGGKHKKMSKGGGSTGVLEKKKRKNDSGGALPKKRSHLIEAVLM